MPRKYEPRSLTIDSLLNWVKSGEIAIPEIQRPFVWSAAKVRDLLDSLFQDFPVGYLIIWKNPDVNLKDGTRSEGKKILIDGQQRITALMAALMGYEVVNKDYKRIRIRISFHPLDKKFQVWNSAIEKDSSWIQDIAVIFDGNFKQHKFVGEYCEQNSSIDPDDLHEIISQLLQIKNNPIGIIELDSSLDVETVTEIFIRVNSEGVALSQADFAMSKIAVNETYNGPVLRKAIDYFCHLAVEPDFYNTIETNDKTFAQSGLLNKMAWLRKENDDLYDPSYSDMLRVAFVSEFGRGKLQDLVALLSGRNFETKRYEDHIIHDTFKRLHEGVLNFINETHFKRFIMIIRSAGIVDKSMVSSQMALNFAYILYLILRREGVADFEIERYVRRWYIMSVLTGRYSGSFETTFESDIRQIESHGFTTYADITFRGQLSDGFWETTLLQQLDSASSNSPTFNIYLAAQVKLNDRGFLSRDITVRELIEYKSDVHHIFPKDLLKKGGLSRGQYNQIANYVVAQSEINIAIGNKSPNTYFQQIMEQVTEGKQRYGNITTTEELQENLIMNCIPEGMEQITLDDYPEFLRIRRQLIAQKIRFYFESL